MTKTLAIPISVALAMTLAAACSKPDTAPAAATADAAHAAGDAAANTGEAGGAVSPPQANGAVNADMNTANTSTEAASNSFTEAEAKGHIENAGYSDVADLAKTPDGLWTGKAKKDGKTVKVALDFKGAVTAR